LAFIVSSIWPPKGINELYGYQTERSKRNPEAWDFAQRYTKRLMINIALLHLLLGLIGVFIELDVLLSVIISLVFMIAMVVWLFKKTEGALKEKFGE
jgi:uncharacterized membrane protein